MGKLNKRKIVQRFLVPRIAVSLIYFLKFRAKISPNAEVELSANVRLGSKCQIGSFTKVKASDGDLVIGDRCGIATGCFIAAAKGGIQIGDNFICGPNVTILSSNYQYHEKGQHLEDLPTISKGVKIGNNVWIGAGSVILDGTVIGDNTVVVANSLLNRKYKPNVILQGSPAKVIMNR